MEPTGRDEPQKMQNHREKNDTTNKRTGTRTPVLYSEKSPFLCLSSHLYFFFFVQVGVNPALIEGVSSDIDFTEKLMAEESVFCLPGQVSVGCSVCWCWCDVCSCRFLECPAPFFSSISFPRSSPCPCRHWFIDLCLLYYRQEL